MDLRSGESSTPRRAAVQRAETSDAMLLHDAVPVSRRNM